MKKLFSKHIVIFTVFASLIGCSTHQQMLSPPRYTPTVVALPATASPQPVYQQSATNSAYTKYNPKTGKLFPANYDYDPASGEQLKSLQ